MRLLKLAAAVAVVALAVTPEAIAQRRSAVTVVVINFQRVMSDSALGRDMQTKLQGIGAQIQQEQQALEPERQAIQAEQERLGTASRGMTDAQIRASATLNPQFTALQQRMQTFQTRARGLQGDAECTQTMVLRDFANQVRPLMQAAMQAQGAGAVLDTSGVLNFDPAAEITATVIQQLDQNQSTRAMNVARHPVAECQGQQGQQGH